MARHCAATNALVHCVSMRNVSYTRLRLVPKSTNMIVALKCFCGVQHHQCHPCTDSKCESSSMSLTSILYNLY